MNARLTMLLAAALAIAATVAGCGGGDSGSEAQAGGEESIQTSSLSKAQYLKKASAACTRERKNLVNEASTYLSEQSAKGLPRSVAIANMGKTVMAPTIEAEIAAIRQLGAPAGDEEQIEAMLADQQAAVDELKELKEAKSAFVLVHHFADATKELQDYGFTACTN